MVDAGCPLGGKSPMLVPDADHVQDQTLVGDYDVLDA